MIPNVGSCEQCCHKRGEAGISSVDCTQVLWVYTQQWDTESYGKTISNF